MTYSMTQSVKESMTGTPAQRVGQLLIFPAKDSSSLSGRRNVKSVAIPLAFPMRPPAMPLESDQGSTQGPSIQSNANSVLEVLRGCRDRLRMAAGVAVAVHVSAESGLPALALDDRSLEHVLLQLVKNAAEAMLEGGSVHIVARRALSRSNPAVLVHVSDDGQGIPAYALEHIFKQGFSSKRDTRGWGEHCGLGLAIVRDLVQSVGGVVEVASTRRRGTTFELRIPCAPQRANTLSAAK
jgi:signal transduction histidine kinase